MNNRSFTLTEVVTSVLIITFLAAIMFTAFVGTQKFFNRAQHRMQAFNFAREAQDRLRADYSYIDSQMKVQNGHLESEIGSIVRGEMTNLNSELRYDVSSEPAPNSYKKVEVKVTWDEIDF